jgi:hypothetical protein
MNKKLIIVLILLITISISSLFFYNSKNDDSSGSKIVISKAVTQGEGELLGTLYVEDNKVVYDKVAPSNLDNYIESRKALWESGSLEYDNGGYTNGIHSTSTKGTTIGDDDFMRAIYVELIDNWNGFDFNLVEGE